MIQSFPVLVVLYAGLTHAFEADHLLAVSNIVSQRKSILMALKDGICWGLGHTSTILIIGMMMIVGRMNIAARTFSYFEAIVGLMLVLVAVYRLVKFRRFRRQHRPSTLHHDHPHLHGAITHDHRSLHRVSYSIGLVHGLAGSGALVVLVMTQYHNAATGIGYLLLFGMGSVLGMLVASALFSLPFSKKLLIMPTLQSIIILLSSGICLLYGIYIIVNNLRAHEV